jgi:integrase/recombinase XerC
MEDFRIYITKIKKYSPKTISAYMAVLVKFFDIHDYKSATKKDILLYLKSQNSNSIKNLTIASLKLFYKFKMRNGEIQHNPTDTVSYARIQNKSIIPITPTEMKNIIKPENFATKEDYVLFETLYLTGMRISELHSLTVNDILQNSIKIVGKSDKQRIIHLEQYAIDNLLSISKGDKIGSYTYNTLRQKMAYYMKDFKRARLTNTTKLSSHGLRHAFATHLSKSGAGILSIKEFMGHSSCKTTQGYTHLDMDFLKNQHNLMRKAKAYT